MRPPGGRYDRLRRATQVAFALFYLVLPFANLAGMRSILGTLGSTRLGPVDLLEPASALSAVLASGFAAPLGTVLVGVAPAVVLTLILGPFFCSWVCPFGLISELTDRLVAPWRRPFGRGAAAKLRVLRIAHLAALLIGSALLAVPLASIFHGPRAISTVALEGFYLGKVSPVAAGILGIVLLADVLLPRRLFCRALCPAGALANFLRTRRTLRVAFDPIRCHCVNRRACLTACRWGLDPRRAGRFDGCTNCLACVDVCHSEALRPTFRPAPPALVQPGFPARCEKEPAATPPRLRLATPLPFSSPTAAVTSRTPVPSLTPVPALAPGPAGTPVPRPRAGSAADASFAGVLAIALARAELPAQPRSDPLEDPRAEAVATARPEPAAAPEPEDRLALVGMQLSGMMHDLRSPLAVISAYAQLMASEECPNERQKSLTVLLDHFSTINAMSREVLDYAQGKTGIYKRKVMLHAFIDSLSDQLRYELERRGIALRLRTCFTGAWRFDEMKVRRAIVNIARNAAEAMGDHGRFTVRVTRRGDSLSFWMRDTGPGIPAEIQKRLFQPFVTHGKKTGTGLGLAVVKRVAEEHGGTITVRTRAGRGATFVLTLPA